MVFGSKSFMRLKIGQRQLQCHEDQETADDLGWFCKIHGRFLYLVNKASLCESLINYLFQDFILAHRHRCRKWRFHYCRIIGFNYSNGACTSRGNSKVRFGDSSVSKDNWRERERERKVCWLILPKPQFAGTLNSTDIPHNAGVARCRHFAHAK